MRILEVATKVWQEVIVDEISTEDLKFVPKRRYFFDWKKEIEHATIYQLRITGDKDIKGLMALVDYPAEYRIEIKLLTASRENVISIKEKGKKQKEYDEIPGNLIAFAGLLAISKYGRQACISLRPKTAIKEHYIRKYGMIDAGTQLFLELESLENLIKRYTP